MGFGEDENQINGSDVRSEDTTQDVAQENYTPATPEDNTVTELDSNSDTGISTREIPRLGTQEPAPVAVKQEPPSNPIITKPRGSAAILNAQGQAILESAPSLEVGMAALRKEYATHTWDQPTVASDVTAMYSAALQDRFGDKSQLSLKDLESDSDKKAPVSFQQIFDTKDKYLADNNLPASKKALGIDDIDIWEKTNTQAIKDATDTNTVLNRGKLLAGVKQTASELRRQTNTEDGSSLYRGIHDAINRVGEGLVGPWARMLGVDDPYKEHTIPAKDKDLSSDIEGGIGALVGAAGAAEVAGPYGIYAYFGPPAVSAVKEIYNQTLDTTNDKVKATEAAGLQAASQYINMAGTGAVLRGPVAGKAITSLTAKIAEYAGINKLAKLGWRVGADIATGDTAKVLDNLSQNAAMGESILKDPARDLIRTTEVYGTLGAIAGARGALSDVKQPPDIIENNGHNPPPEEHLTEGIIDADKTAILNNAPEHAEDSKVSFTTEDGHKFIDNQDGTGSTIRLNPDGEVYQPLNKTSYVDETTAAKLAVLKSTTDVEGNPVQILHTEDGKLVVKSPYVGPDLIMTDQLTGQRLIEVPVTNRSIGSYPVEANRPKSKVSIEDTQFSTEEARILLAEQEQSLQELRDTKPANLSEEESKAYDNSMLDAARNVDTTRQAIIDAKQAPITSIEYRSRIGSKIINTVEARIEASTEDATVHTEPIRVNPLSNQSVGAAHISETEPRMVGSRFANSASENLYSNFMDVESGTLLSRYSPQSNAESHDLAEREIAEKGLVQATQDYLNTTSNTAENTLKAGKLVQYYESAANSAEADGNMDAANKYREASLVVAHKLDELGTTGGQVTQSYREIKKIIENLSPKTRVQGIVKDLTTSAVHEAAKEEGVEPKVLEGLPAQEEALTTKIEDANKQYEANVKEITKENTGEMTSSHDEVLSQTEQAIKEHEALGEQRKAEEETKIVDAEKEAAKVEQEISKKENPTEKDVQRVAKLKQRIDEAKQELASRKPEDFLKSPEKKRLLKHREVKQQLSDLKSKELAEKQKALSAEQQAKLKQAKDTRDKVVKEVTEKKTKIKDTRTKLQKKIDEKLKDFTPEDQENLRKLYAARSVASQVAPEGKYTARLDKLIQKAEAKVKKQITAPHGLIYSAGIANLISGPDPLITKAKGDFVNMVSAPVSLFFNSIARANPRYLGMAGRAIESAWKAKGQGLESAKNAALTGETSYGEANSIYGGFEKGDFVSELENTWLGKKMGPKMSRTLGWALGYPFRAFAGITEGFYTTAKEMHTSIGADLSIEQDVTRADWLTKKLKNTDLKEKERAVMSNELGIIKEKYGGDITPASVQKNRSDRLHNSTAEWNSAKEEVAKVKEQIVKSGQKMSAADERQMVYDIIQNRRSPELVDQAKIEAQNNTFSGRIPGFVGEMTRAFQAVLEKASIPVWGSGKLFGRTEDLKLPVGKMAFMFTKIGGYVAQTTVAFDPIIVGPYKNINNLYRSFSEPYSLEFKTKQVMDLGRWMTGLTLFGVFGSIVYNKKDDPNANIMLWGKKPVNPSDAAMWNALKRQEWSIQIGAGKDARYIKFAEIPPLAAPFGALAGMLDHYRYNKTKKLDTGLAELAVYGTLGETQTIMDHMFFRNMKDLISAFETPSASFLDKALSSLRSTALNTSRAAIPWVGMQRFITTMYDNPQDTRNNFKAQLMNKTIVAGWSGAPEQLNHWGDPVERDWTDRVTTIVRNMVKGTNDPQDLWLGQNNYILPDPNHQTLSTNEKTLRTRNHPAIAMGDLTTSEKEELTKNAGPELRNMVRDMQSKYGNSAPSARVQEMITARGLGIINKWQYRLFIR